MSGYADTIRRVLSAPQQTGAAYLDGGQARKALDALNRLEAELVEQADRIAWLEGDVADWRIKLAECEAQRDRRVHSKTAIQVREPWVRYGHAHGFNGRPYHVLTSPAVCPG